MRPKPGLGARAISGAIKLIEDYNDRLKTSQSSHDHITAYAPRYSCQISIGVYRERYVFPNLFFVHTTAEVMKQFMSEYPYQIFYTVDVTRHSDTNHDEYGTPTHDNYMRATTHAIGEFYLALNAYQEDVRIFTAQELQQLKYTHKVLIVDGPLRGRTCRIKSIEGKKRVIIELLEGNIALVLLMPQTHFQRL